MQYKETAFLTFRKRYYILNCRACPTRKIHFMRQFTKNIAFVKLMCNLRRKMWLYTNENKLTNLEELLDCLRLPVDKYEPVVLFLGLVGTSFSSSEFCTISSQKTFFFCLNYVDITLFLFRLLIGVPCYVYELW